MLGAMAEERASEKRGASLAAQLTNNVLEVAHGGNLRKDDRVSEQPVVVLPQRVHGCRVVVNMDAGIVLGEIKPCRLREHANDREGDRGRWAEGWRRREV